MARYTRDPGPRRQWLTVNQVAEIWQVSPRTIWRLIEKGQIRAEKIGRSVRIHPDVVEPGPRDSV